MPIPRMDFGFVATGLVVLAVVGSAPWVAADGYLVPPGRFQVYPPAEYSDPLWERAQEAIIMLQPSERLQHATEDLILQLNIEASAKIETFSWLIPFPNEPETSREDARIFRELKSYVKDRKRELRSREKGSAEHRPPRRGEGNEAVEVLSRETVGSYEVAVVREEKPGALNDWLQAEGFRTIEEDGSDITEFYRKKGYVFACVKVTDVELSKGKPVDLHPLRFTFETGGRDGVYFPMKMTSLQKEPFDVNLYVFHRTWINDRLNKYGFEQRGFQLDYREGDSKNFVPDAPKAWSHPETDPHLREHASKIPTLAKLFQKLHPGKRYYLTNLSARGLKPKDVRSWADDLWVFPYYLEEDFVPLDARPGGPGAGAWAASDAETRDASKEKDKDKQKTRAPGDLRRRDIGVPIGPDR